MRNVSNGRFAFISYTLIILLCPTRMLQLEECLTPISQLPTSESFCTRHSFFKQQASLLCNTSLFVVHVLICLFAYSFVLIFSHTH
ncbi:unnamed protein product [Brugia timori]|uniref:Secreted protein n=1 Tax=Brugia timori TaxID=42155 RepID=A0A0R3QAK0_9BILA|nr:unnamed protein product [Brugia timori]